LSECVICGEWREDIAKGYLSSGFCKRCELANELGISIEDADKVLGRMKDIGDPSKWLTLDEFIERVETLVNGDPDVEEDCPHDNMNISVNGRYCEDCNEVFEDNTGSNLKGG